LVQKHDIGLIAFAIHNISPAERQRLITICNRTKARIVMIPDILGTLNIVLEPRNGREDAAHPLKNDYGERNLISQDCKDRFSPNEVSGWLSELDKYAKSGDLKSLQERVKNLQLELQPIGIQEITPVEESPSIHPIDSDEKSTQSGKA
jgi:hypothetical protein